LRSGSRAVGETVAIPKGLKVRRLHKAFLRYHDANNWPVLRESSLTSHGPRPDLIGPGKQHLVPPWQPAGTGGEAEGRRTQKFRTQHTGLPINPARRSPKAKR
jgi:hypothetical protein